MYAAVGPSSLDVVCELTFDVAVVLMQNTAKGAAGFAIMAVVFETGIAFITK